MLIEKSFSNLIFEWKYSEQDYSSKQQGTFIDNDFKIVYQNIQWEKNLKILIEVLNFQIIKNI